MAGIGFVLTKLAAKDDLLGIARAYTHAALASSGPWLFTVLALGGITLLYADYNAALDLLNFRAIVIYNFAFSLSLSAPIFMVVTRYLADRIHFKDVTQAPTTMLFSLMVVFLLELPIAVIFYGLYVELEPALKFSAIANLFIISAVWVLAVYMTALKDYITVSWSFLIGMVIAVVCAQYLKGPYGDVGMLTGFNIGLTFLLFSLCAKVFAEYPYKLESGRGVRAYFRKYWQLAVGGFFYNAAIWVDKWIMWFFAPEAVKLPSKMVMYPDYDSAMFMAILSIVPAMAAFVLSVETRFFLRYKKFYYDILEHKPLHRIKENQQSIVNSVLGSARNMLVIQGTICFLCIVLAPRIIELFNVNYVQIGIFRLGVLGAFFHVLMLFQLIILSYFDCRRQTMWLQGLFLITNIIFTFVSLQWGFQYYGYGYFLAALISFFATSLVLFSHIRNLPYHAFITSNNSLRGVFQRLKPEQLKG